MDELEREAFESKIRETVVARMAELQFGSRGPLMRSMGAVGGKVDKMASTSRQLDQQLAQIMKELDGMERGWKQSAKRAQFEKGKRPVDAPDITKDLRRAKQKLDQAASGLGQVVENLYDAANILS